MNIGFTGTRNGMTEEQKHEVETLLKRFLVGHVHHGDCVGADADFHSIARSLQHPLDSSSKRFAVIIHPPVDESHRAFCKDAWIRPAKTHFARNRDIVIECDILIATPRLMIEEDHGGTWYTIRFARKQSKRIVIMWPNGSVTQENGGYEFPMADGKQ